MIIEIIVCFFFIAELEIRVYILSFMFGALMLVLIVHVYVSAIFLLVERENF